MLVIEYSSLNARPRTSFNGSFGREVMALEVEEPHQEAHTRPLQELELDIRKAFITPSHTHLTLSELPDEITQSIFSFISSSELMSATQVCSAWRRFGSDDKYILERVGDYSSEKLPASGYRKDLIAVLKYRKLLAELDIQYDKHNRRSSRAELYTAGFVTFLLFIGFLVYSIMFVLFLDNAVPDTPRNHSLMLIPFICLFGIPFLVCAVCSHLMRKICYWKWYKCADRMRRMDSSTSGRYSYIQSRQLVGGTLILMLGYLGVMPVAGSAAYVKLVFDLRRVPWKYTFSPYYFYSALYLIYPPVFLWLIGIRWTKIKHQIECVIIVVWVGGALLNVYLAIQLGFVGAKLDSTLGIHANWFAILTPTWACLLFICLLSLLCCVTAMCWEIATKNIKHRCISMWTAMDSRYISDILATIGCVGTYCCILLTPVALWLILFAVRLEGYANYLYVYSFIPLYATAGMVCMTMSCVCLLAKFAVFADI